MSARVLVLSAVLCYLSVAYCDEGFIDDFFNRFPELPFSQIHPVEARGNGGYYKTLYNMHKNQRGPGTRCSVQFFGGLYLFFI
jgi:hypothetical protein